MKIFIQLGGGLTIGGKGIKIWERGYVCVCVCVFVCGGSPHSPVWKTLLRVNETKFISEMAFIVDLFALGDEKRSPYDERTFFGPSYSVLTCLLTLSL